MLIILKSFDRSSPKPRMMVCGSPPQSPTASMVVTPTPTPGSDVDPELHTFREAIALSGMFFISLFLLFVTRVNFFLNLKLEF